MQPKVPGLRIMGEGILVPQWQTLLLLLPPGDLGTCCCLHQITVTRVFCLTSNLPSPLESFLGCQEEFSPLVCPVTRLPQSQCIAAHQLSILLYHCSSPSCAPHHYGEKLLPTVFRHKETYSRSPMSIHHPSNSIAPMMLTVNLVRVSHHLLILSHWKSFVNYFQLSLPTWWSQIL